MNTGFMDRYYIAMYLMAKYTFNGRNDLIKMIFTRDILCLHVQNCTECGQGQGHICQTLKSKHWLETETSYDVTDY